MAITLTCPECANSLPGSAELLGKKIRCKSCQHVFVAAVTKVHAGGGDSGARSAAATSPSRNGSANGVHHKRASKPAAPAKPKDHTLLYAGGGSALVAVAAVMVWALFFKGDQTPDNDKKPVVAQNTGPRIDSQDSAVESAPKTSTETKAANDGKDTKSTEAQPASMAQAPIVRKGFGPSPKVLPATIDKAIGEKVRKSAVMLLCIGDDGGGEGSGWIAERKDNHAIVITNSHVVGMKEPATKPPHKIRVYIDRGLPTERDVSGELLGIDRTNDLAVVRIQGKNLPDPLPVCPSGELGEGTPLYVMGFPLGSALANEASGRGQGGGNAVAPTVKFRPTSISSRLPYKSGGVKWLQIEGGAIWGNSGGAVLDTAGNVRAILVAGKAGTQVVYCIPCEYAVYLLRGRMMSLTPGQAYKGGTTGTLLPLTAAIEDPMGRIVSVSLTMWAGAPGSRVRPATDKQPTPLSGDSAWSDVPLEYNRNLTIRLGENRPAIGECQLPPCGAGQVYWAQPKYVRTDGTTSWGEAIVCDFSAEPVDRSGAHLAVKHQPGSERTVDILAASGVGVGPEGSSPPVGKQEYKSTLTEKTRNSVAEGAVVHYRYEDFGFKDEDLNDYLRETEKDLMATAKGMGIEAIMTNRGLIMEPKSNLTHVRREYRGFLEGVNRQNIAALESFALALPGKDVSANETWTIDLPFELRVPIRGQNKDISYKMKYKYLGSRTRNSREEAVITFEGLIVKGSGGGSRTAGNTTEQTGGFDQVDEAQARRDGVWGVVRGAALVDLRTGLTKIGKSAAHMAVAVKLKVRDQNNQEREIDATVGALQETEVQRLFTKNAPRDLPEVVLPEQTILHNPYVGSPDPNHITPVQVGGGDATASEKGATGISPLEMKKADLDRVTAAACFIRTRNDHGQADGTGWLAEPGIVVTNAQVIMMLEKVARPPTSIEVIFNSGLPNMKKYPAKVLTVDHERDLAVLQLPTKDGLPDPMPIVPSSDLYPSQRVYVVGFPYGQVVGAAFGDGIDKASVELKIRESTVSGFFDNPRTKFRKYVLMEGGVTEGNIGGAVVDTNGAVRGVAAGTIQRDRQMCFSIPSEYVARLLTGFPLEVKPGLAYKAGAIVKQPVEVKFGDPLKRVKNVYLDYWVGRPGNPRRNSQTAPKPVPEDMKRESIACTYDAEKAQAYADFELPEAVPGFALWIQPRFTDGSGKEVWGDAIFYAPDGPPVERRDIMLKAKFQPGAERLIDVRSAANYRTIYLGQDIGSSNYLFVSLAEKVLRFDAIHKKYVVSYEYTDLKFGDMRGTNPLMRLIFQLGEQAQPVLDLIKQLISLAGYSADGVMTIATVPDPSRIPRQLHSLFGEFNNQVLQSIQTMSVKLPNRIVKYGEEWEQDSNLLIESRNRYDPSLFRLKMKYMGVRDRGGRQEAVVEINGSIRQDPNAKSIEIRELENKGDEDPKGKDAPKGKDEPKGKAAPKGKAPPKGKGTSAYALNLNQALPPAEVKGKKPLFGLVRGRAYIDVESGVVAHCDMYLDIDAEILHKDKQTGAEIPVRSGGTIEMELNRRLSVR